MLLINARLAAMVFVAYDLQMVSLSNCVAVRVAQERPAWRESSGCPFVPRVYRSPSRTKAPIRISRPAIAAITLRQSDPRPGHDAIHGTELARARSPRSVRDQHASTIVEAH